MQLPLYISLILETLENAGYPSYVVGGSVRDYLLGSTPCDYDIATKALPEEVINLFPHTALTGIKFGTVTVLTEKPVEVTTFRKDSFYSDSRHPLRVSFTADIKDDLSRRDFTINAIAYSIKDGFFDPLHGRADLENKVIKAVGSPEKRFKEDALRILRAIRFLSTLGYGFEIEETTLFGMIESASLLSLISKERLTIEINKLLLGVSPGKAIAKLALISPKAFKQEFKLFSLADLPLKLELRLSCLLKNNPWFENWLVLPKKTRTAVKKILTDYPLPQSQAQLRHLCFNIGRDHLDDWLAFRKQKPQANNLVSQPITVDDLAISGSEVAKILGTGPLVGQVLFQLAFLVREDPSLNNRDKLLELIRSKKEP